MAKSSALSTSNKYIKYTIEIIQNSQNVNNNTSNVTVKVRFYRTNTGYETYGSGTVYCKINGTKYSASVSASQKITNSGIVLFSKTLDIKHGSDGKKTLTTSAWIDHSKVTSSEQSYRQELKTIPRKSTLSVGNGTLGTSQNLVVTRQSTSFTHSIKVVCGNVTRYINADGTLSTTEVKHSDCDISFTPPIELASQNTSSVAVTVKYTITTYNGSTSVGSNDYTKTCAIPSSVVPSLSVAISEATTLEFGVYVQSVSKLAIKITPTLAYGSEIESYKTTVDGMTYTASDFTTEVLKGKGELAIVVTITDKRGRTATYNDTISVLEYSPPSITNLNVIRCNSDGTSNNQGEYAKVTFHYSFTSLGGHNELETKTNYKTKSESVYTPLSTDYHDGNEATGTETYIFAADTTSSYDVEIVATDAIQTLFGRPDTKCIASLGTIKKFLSLFKNIGLAIGKVFDTSKPNTVQIGFDIYDKHNTQIRNGVVAYTGAGDAGIDANTTLEHCFLTMVNTPNNSQFWYVIQYFYSTKSETEARMQVAYPYKVDDISYSRYFINGAWSEWRSAIDAIPDSGWIYPTLNADFKHYETTHLTRYRKVGNQVYIQGEITPAKTIPADSTQRTVFTLPEGYRPSDRIFKICQGSGKRHWMLGVQTSGVVTHSRYGSQGVYLEANVDDHIWFPFYITFFVD